MHPVLAEHQGRCPFSLPPSSDSAWDIWKAFVLLYWIAHWSLLQPFKGVVC